MELKYTDEQLRAINIPVGNVMISAGAGSGKTKVLTQRVFNHVLSGVDIDSLLVLTFTNAAAKEMKKRIRDTLFNDKEMSNEKREDQLNKIDSSYIMTFDAYSLFLVKKYHHLLNVDSNIEVADSNIVDGIVENIIDDIFKEEYLKKDQTFIELINNYCVKDDKLIRDFVIELNKKLDLIFDREDYLKNYENTFYSDEAIEKSIKEYTNIIIVKLKQLKVLIEQLDEPEKVYPTYKEIDYVSDYLQARKCVENCKKAKAKKGEELSEKDEALVKQISVFRSTKLTPLVKLDVDDFKLDYRPTKKYALYLLKLADELDKRLNLYKQNNNLYEFNDIAKMAIKVVSEYPEIRDEIKNHFYEILIDEYQDTSDIQELLISLISNDNVYVVGDIKQSIYRFRNANPDIFKNKYEEYSKGINGTKVDLTYNFRSRFEVLRDINVFFNRTMTSSMGGANYTLGHQLVAGNKSYIQDEKYKTDILEYDSDLLKNHSADVIEAIIIAKDIRDKVDNYQLKDSKAQYKDFTILIDRSTKFDTFKKILTYYNIPVFIETEEKLSESDLLTFIRSVFSFLGSSNFDAHSYMSIQRSFVCEISDEQIYDEIKNKKYVESNTYRIIESIKSSIENKTITNILDEIIDKFDVYAKLGRISNVHASNVKIDYLYTLASNLESLGYTYKDFNDYLSGVFDRDSDIKFRISNEVENAVRLTNYHKSKGLEYNIVYYPCLGFKFNDQDKNGAFLFSKQQGIVMPCVKDGLVKTTYQKEIFKYNYDVADISERIRLFYVALTRAKEKMILVTSFKDGIYVDDEIIDDSIKLKINSYKYFLSLIRDDLSCFVKPADILDADILDDYEINNDVFSFLHKEEKIEVLPSIKIEPIVNKTSHFSKSAGLIDQELLNKMEFGTKMHYYLETLDFNSPDFSDIENRFVYKLKSFLNSDLMKDVSKAKVYKEYEFIYNEETEEKHGIIDLLLEYDDYFVIIDYKTKNIDDEHYDEQLNGYRNYIRQLSNKEVKCYLYSIIDETYREVVE